MSDLKFYRNYGLFSHVNAGKTIITERIFKSTGRTYQNDRVSSGESTIDCMEQEADRGITMQSLGKLSCSGGRCNLLDIPKNVTRMVQ